MKDALAALFGAAFTVAACYALGSVAAARLRLPLRRQEKFPLAFLLGAACLHLAIFAILALKIAYTPVLIAALAIPIVWAAWTGDWRLPPGKGAPSRSLFDWAVLLLFGGIALWYTVLYLSNAWAPEFSPDGSGYHLGLVARYLRAHGFERVETNFYSSLSEGVEMLFLPAFAIGKHSAAALVHFAFLIALALAMLAYGKRIEKPWAGAAGALLVYLTPVVGIDGTSAYNDVAAAGIAFGVFYLLELWELQQEPRILIAIGLLAGYSYAAKYTAAVIAIYALGLVAWKARRLKPVIAVAACAALMALPWVIKNWIYFQNPIAPFANGIFRNPYITPDFERGWTSYLANYGLKTRWELIPEVMWRGSITAGILGVALFALPLGFLALRWRPGRRLLIPGALFLAAYFGNVGTRFLIPSLPFLTLALALALEPLLPVLVLLVAFHAWLSWPPQVRRHSPDAWTLQHAQFRAALRRVSQDQFLSRFWEYHQAHMIEKYVPEGGRVLAFGNLPDAYTSREIIVSFQGALNTRLADMMNIGWAESFQPTRVLVFSFPERGLRRVRILQTARVSNVEEQWSVHEVRFAHAKQELPRRGEWRLRAFPNPWDVQMAFDNSEATRWRSYENARPGMYIDVDFGREEIVDQVRLETSQDDPDVRLRLEAMDEHGNWTTLADHAKVEPMKYDGSLRLAATHELHLRGVDYVFVRDSDWGASEYSGLPQSWGLKRIAHDWGATLYRIAPEGSIEESKR